MRKNSRTLALLLCFCLMLSLLAGCGKSGAQAPANAPSDPAAAVTPEPSPTPTPEPTPEPIDYRAVYQEASEALAQLENLCVDSRISREITMPDFAAQEPGLFLTLTEESDRHAEFTGLQGDALCAVITDSLRSCKGDEVEQKLVYADGVEYVDFSGSLFFAEVKGQEFLDAQLPLLPDAEQFDTLEGEEQADGGYLVRFSGAKEGARRLMPEEAELLDAAGTAAVSSEGMLTDASYELRYRFCGMEILCRCEGSFAAPEEADLSGEVPENTKSYESLDDPDAPLRIWQARALYQNANAVNTAVTANYYCEAAAISLRNYDEISFLDREDNFLLHEECSLSLVNYETQQTGGYSYKSDYADGELVLHMQGDDQEQRTPVETQDLREKIWDLLAGFFPDYADLKDAEVQEVGEYLLLRFAGTEDYGLKVKDQVCRQLFTDDPALLDNYATAYMTRSLEGYLAMDKLSGIPTALHLSFTGIHTLEGSPYELSLELNIGMNLYTENAADDILEEPVTGPEPEQRPTPVFYEVRDDDGHLMYLMGTIHIGDDRTAYLPQVITDSLAASDALAVEFDTDSFLADVEDDPELQELLAKSYYYMDGSQIQNHLDSALYKEALDLMRVSGSDTDLVNQLKPYVWANGLELFYLSQGREFSSEKGVDSRLERLARAAGQEILNVESGEFQIGLLTGYSDAVQSMLLSETVEVGRTEYLRQSRELYEFWCAGVEEELIEMLAAKDEEERAALDEDELAIYDEYHQKMEVERNAGMLEVAKGYLQGDRTVFFAVGLAHLLGEGGLVQALRDAGYTVTLIDTH